MAVDTEVPLTERTPEAPEPQPDESRSPNDEVSLLDLLIILASRKWLIAKTTGIFVILGLILALVLPKKYTATSTVMPPEHNNSFSSMLASQLGGVGGLISLAGGASGLLKNPNDQYVAMFQSRTVEDATIKDFGLQKEYKQKLLSRTRRVFDHNFKVNGSEKDGFIHVSVTDRNPQRAAALANGWVDQFRKLSQRLATGAAAQRRAFFETQLNQAKDNLANAEASLKAVQEKTGMIQVGAQTRALIQSSATLQAQIAAKEVQLQALQAFATNQNAQVVETEEELAGLRAQLVKLGGSGSASSASLVLPKGQIPQASIDYANKLREVTYRQTLLEILARQVEMAKLDEAKQGALIQVVDPAVPPDYKSSPHRALIVIVAFVLGILFGIFVVLVRAGLARAQKYPEVHEKLISLRKAVGFTRPRSS